MVVPAAAVHVAPLDEALGAEHPGLVPEKLLEDGETGVSEKAGGKAEYGEDQ